jgi:Bacterial regulatory helix-turn-helix proteins, AraC family
LKGGARKPHLHQTHRIARAIDWLKSNFAQPLHVDELAALARMSASRFHHHFRQLTSMSPLQFQKWLRHPCPLTVRSSAGLRPSLVGQWPPMSYAVRESAHC